MALTPVAWAIATHAEAHSLHLALLAILLWLLVTWDERVGATAGTRRAAGGGDRYLVAAAVVFGLAVGNHSLTLLLAIPIGLYVLAVDPGIWRRGRLVLGCVAALALTIVVVYLELPLRAGPFPAPLVYGRRTRGTASATSSWPSSSRAACRIPSGTCPASSASS